MRRPLVSSRRSSVGQRALPGRRHRDRRDPAEADHGIEHQRSVFRIARQRPVHLARVPGERHRIVRYQAGRRANADDAAERGRNADRAAEVGALRHRHHAGRDRNRGAAGRACRTERRVPRIARRPEQRVDGVARRRRIRACWSWPARSRRRLSRRRTTSASSVGTLSLNSGEPKVVRMPAVGVTSLMPTGRPCSGAQRLAAHHRRFRAPARHRAPGRWRA